MNDCLCVLVFVRDIVLRVKVRGKGQADFDVTAGFFVIAVIDGMNSVRIRFYGTVPFAL